MSASRWARPSCGRPLSGHNFDVGDEGTKWKLLGALSGIVSAALTRRLLRVVWQRARGGNPPVNPAARGTTWSEALTWAAASGVAMAVARVVAQRGAAEAWKASTGSYPPGLETVGP